MRFMRNCEGTLAALSEMQTLIVMFKKPARVVGFFIGFILEKNSILLLQTKLNSNNI